MKSLINPVEKVTEYLNLTLGIQDCFNKPIKKERIGRLVSIFKRDYSSHLTDEERISAEKELEFGMNLYNLIKDKTYHN